jgi:hypothetical protein
MRKLQCCRQLPGPPATLTSHKHACCCHQVPAGEADGLAAAMLLQHTQPVAMPQGLCATEITCGHSNSRCACQLTLGGLYSTAEGIVTLQNAHAII